MKKVFPPSPNEQRYFDLLNALRILLQPDQGSAQLDNISALARILGVTRPTAVKLMDRFDPWPWWPDVFILAIKTIMPHADSSKRQIAAGVMRHLPDEVLLPIEDAIAGVDYLRAQLANGPKRAKHITRLEQRGSISLHSIERAAKRMNVIKERVMHKGKLRSMWRLPDADDFA